VFNILCDIINLSFLLSLLATREKLRGPTSSVLVAFLLNRNKGNIFFGLQVLQFLSVFNSQCMITVYALQPCYNYNPNLYYMLKLHVITMCVYSSLKGYSIRNMNMHNNSIWVWIFIILSISLVLSLLHVSFR